MFGGTVIAYVFLLIAISIGVVIGPPGASRRWRPAKARVRMLVGLAFFLIILPIVTPALPDAPLAWVFPGIARAETVSSPQYVAPLFSLMARSASSSETARAKRASSATSLSGAWMHLCN